MPPVSPMLAKLSRELPAEGGMLYVPTWAGFRGADVCHGAADPSSAAATNGR